SAGSARGSAACTDTIAVGTVRFATERLAGRTSLLDLGPATAANLLFQPVACRTADAVPAGSVVARGACRRQSQSRRSRRDVHRDALDRAVAPAGGRCCPAAGAHTVAVGTIRFATQRLVR